MCLGSFAWEVAFRALSSHGVTVKPRARFGHGAVASAGGYELLGCYHPSQQNTFTGRLTETMLDDVLGRARELAA